MVPSYHTNVAPVKRGELQMRVRFVCFMIIFFGAFVLITGCGEEDITEPETEPEAEMVEPEDPCMQKGPPTDRFTVTPFPGEVISSTQEFTLTFDTAFG